MLKYVYYFGGGTADGHASQKELLGGKGANLHEMTRIDLPVPAGFTITTEVCTYFYEHKKKYPPQLAVQVQTALHKIEHDMGMKFGDPANPLLVSVRSGARASMPGMMDTVLNLGITPDTLRGVIKRTNNERFAYDAYRRFINMFGSILMGIDRQKFERALEKLKSERRVTQDTD